MEARSARDLLPALRLNIGVMPRGGVTKFGINGLTRNERRTGYDSFTIAEHCRGNLSGCCRGASHAPFACGPRIAQGLRRSVGICACWSWDCVLAVTRCGVAVRTAHAGRSCLHGLEPACRTKAQERGYGITCCAQPRSRPRPGLAASQIGFVLAGHSHTSFTAVGASPSPSGAGWSAGGTGRILTRRQVCEMCGPSRPDTRKPNVEISSRAPPLGGRFRRSTKDCALGRQNLRPSFTGALRPRSDLPLPRRPPPLTCPP